MSDLDIGVSGGGGGGSDVVASLAIAQEINRKSIDFGWRTSEDEGLLSAIARRVFGETLTSTTVSELILNSTELQTVISNVDLILSLLASTVTAPTLISSTTFMNEVAGSADLMRSILSTGSALGLIMEDATTRATFTASTALTVSEIPQMNSNTSPSGVASASSVESPGTNDAWRAFNRNTADFWLSNQQPAWLDYQFTAACSVHTAEWNRGNFGSNKPITGTLQAYVSGNWTDVLEMPVSGSGTEVAYAAKGAASNRWRVNNMTGSAANMLVSTLQLKGFFV